MSNNTTSKAIIVGLGVSLVCSVLVAMAAVFLKPIQEKNKALEIKKNILKVSGLLKEDTDIEESFARYIRPVIISLEKGTVLTKENYPEQINPENFDLKKVIKDSSLTAKIPSDADIAKIRVIPKNMIVYNIYVKGKLTKIILPVYGKGLWSTMYGFLALDADKRTIRGITFYEHGETPGLGGEIDNPGWQKKWEGKIAFDKNWEIKIKVIKGKIAQKDPAFGYTVDGLSGATLTTVGVNNLVRFWLGEKEINPEVKSGYYHYLKNLQEVKDNE